MLLLRLLSCLERFPLQLSSPSAGIFYATSIINNLWSYRISYGLYHEYWLVEACYVAATSIVSAVKDNPSLYKLLLMACQLLYEYGTHLPIANEYHLAIQQMLSQQDLSEVKLPEAIRLLYNALIVRIGSITIQNVTMVNLTGLDNEAYYNVKYVTFTSCVRSIHEANR